ncbi:MAG: helix-turn-helix domain-containing protein [Parvibaculaceae bacterium]|nr:helix-turn-helix domain-containing protein [Parvibaculaceae bacterium]
MSQAKPLETPIGQILKGWRAKRHLSQLALSLEAGVSARHISFVETGRSRPSRELVVQLADALLIPYRDRNMLFLAAGFAPIYTETNFNSDDLKTHRRLIEMILKRYEPFGAVAVDRAWNILLSNSGFQSTLDLLELPQTHPEICGNILKLLFSPDGLRPHIVNWHEVGHHLYQRAHREAIEGGSEAQKTLKEISETCDIPSPWHLVDISKPLELMVPLHMRIDGMDLRFYTTITTLGTPQDITLQELRIEAFLPADTETETLIEGFAADQSPA